MKKEGKGKRNSPPPSLPSPGDPAFLVFFFLFLSDVQKRMSPLFYDVADPSYPAVSFPLMAVV